MKSKKKKNREMISRKDQKLKSFVERLENQEVYISAVFPISNHLDKLAQDVKEIFKTIFLTKQKILMNEHKRKKEMELILSELIMGAYQDRFSLYTISSHTTKTEILEKMQTTRQRADLHLVRLMQAFNEINRQPVKVIVKEAGQVNVGEKQMNVDKQMNVNISDLDKKNERID